MTVEETEALRERLLAGWDQAAAGWGRQADRMNHDALPVSRWMLDHTGPLPGDTVLELGAGSGDTGLMAAAELGLGGTVIISDASVAMLEIPREKAAAAKLGNVEFRQLQLEWIDLPTASVDVVLCRWAIMLTLDPGTALRECRRVLRPGGRLAVAVWDSTQANPWASLVTNAVRDLGYAKPRPVHGPGLFSLSDAEALQNLLADAGFLDITLDRIGLQRVYRDVVDWLGETRDLSIPFQALWRRLDDDARRKLRELLIERGGAHRQADGTLVFPASCIVLAAGA
ncbi:MAG: class I SAM-dependent methyltransferase [Solirubrobacteraceae bacterium]